MLRQRSFVLQIICVMIATSTMFFGARGYAANLTDSLTKGTPELKSIGALAFAPEGILLIGDSKGAAVIALATGDTESRSPKGELKLDAINEKIASMLGTSKDQILINDMKVNPLSGNLYLSVSRGKGEDASPVLCKMDREGKLTEVSLKEVAFAKVMLPASNTKVQRSKEIESITALGFVDNQVIVAGLSNEEFSSRLRVIPFPFKTSDKGASIEIFHGAHGRLETNSPIRTFIPYTIGGESNVLASYTCTPLVTFPVKKLKEGEKLRGTTVAELGNGNRPLDMITYQKEGKQYLLMANSSRGIMKVDLTGIEKIDPITKQIRGTAGLKYDTIKELVGIVQLDKLDDGRAVVLQNKSGTLNVMTIPLP